jgi:hypothetical protein
VLPSKYTTLILVLIPKFQIKKQATKIGQQNGGTLIVYQDANKWLNKNELTALTLKILSWKLRKLHLSKQMTIKERKKL